VAYAIVRGDVPRVVIAANEDVLARVVALEVVAATPAAELGGHAEGIRAALLDEQWPEAVLAWMEATGNVVDAYPDEQVWREADLDEERTALELRVARLFRDDRVSD
jgi:hypothetical protein